MLRSLPPKEDNNPEKAKGRLVVIVVRAAWCFGRGKQCSWVLGTEP